MSARNKNRILVSGLGGGLDIVNASLLYYAMMEEGNNVSLGSVRPVSQSSIRGGVPFSDSGTLILPKSHIVGREKNRRYIEPMVSKLTRSSILLFSTRYRRKLDIVRLSQAFKDARVPLREEKLNYLFFVDGGGDSLIFRREDAKDSEFDDPFEGGDAHSLAALEDFENAYLCVISKGLDIKVDAFERNRKLLQERGHYFGRVNLATGEKEDFQLEDLVGFDESSVEGLIGIGKNRSYLNVYNGLAQRTLLLRKDDFKKPDGRMVSHTATVTYHAMNGEFGPQRTFVDWEPNLSEGRKGVRVTKGHQWMYFFDAGAIHRIKKEING